MNPWKRRFLLKTIIFRFHVSFWGGIILTNYCSFHQKYLCNLCNLLYKPTSVPRVAFPTEPDCSPSSSSWASKGLELPVFGVLFFEATKSPFIDRNQGTRDQQKTTRRVGVGYSRKLTLSTLMMFILFTSFFRFEKKTIPATQKSSGIRDSTSSFGLARFEPFLWPILGKSPHKFSTRSTFKLKFYHTWGCRQLETNWVHLKRTNLAVHHIKFQSSQPEQEIRM